MKLLVRLWEYGLAVAAMVVIVVLLPFAFLGLLISSLRGDDGQSWWQS